MAQIKKFQKPASPITKEQTSDEPKPKEAPKETTSKYGRLIQNGVEIQANDDMINWLAQQGYYGKQMSENLRNGNDQYIDVDDQGAGWIRNISVANPDLKEKQNERTTRLSRRLEGRKLNQARNDIQRLATYDYNKFVETPKVEILKPYEWEDLVIDYIKSKNGDKTTYKFSDAKVNKDIIARLDNLDKGLIIPEGYEFKDADDKRTYYATIKDKMPELKTRLINGTLTENDESILESLGIYKEGRNHNDSKITPETDNLIDIIKTQMGITNEDLIKRMYSDFTLGTNGRLIPKKALSDRFGNNYWFSENDADGYNKYAGYALLNGELVKVGSTPWNTWINSSQGKAFVENYNLGAWNDAAKFMGFYGSDTDWSTYDPNTHFSSYLEPYTKYRDISGYYNLDGYLGVYDILSTPGTNGLSTKKRIAIKNDGTVEDASLWNKVSATPRTYTTSAIHELQSIQGLDNTKGIPLADDDRFWLTIDTNGIKHVYEKNRIRNGYSEVNLGDISKLSINEIKELIANHVSGKMVRRQVGGIMLPTTTPEKVLITPISDPSKPYSTKDIVNGVAPNISDIADLTSLALDLGGFVGGEIPGLGETLGYLSDVSSFVGDVTRDGFQWGDVGNLATNAGITTVGLVPVIGTGTGMAKVLKSTKKLEPFIRGGFTALGLYQGLDSLDNILSGDFTTEDLRMFANGIMALRGIYKNRKGHNLMDTYGESKTKSKTNVDIGGEDLLKGLSKEKQLEIKKKAVDAAIKADNNVTTFEGNKVDWIDDSGKVIDYEKAWKGLRENGHITDKMLKENRSWFEGVKNEAGKAKSVVSEKAESGWEWLKRQIMPVDASQYKMRSDMSDEEIKAFVDEIGPRYMKALQKQYVGDWEIPSNKNGGKLRKCQDGDELEGKWWESSEYSSTLADQETPEESKKTPKKSKKAHVAGYNNANKIKALEILNRIPGIIGPGISLATTLITNKGVYDTISEGIGKKYIGAQKSMPIQQPYARYNIAPMISMFDQQKTDTRTLSNQIARNLSDQKLQVAQNLATEDRIYKAESDLLDNISKRITDVDLHNLEKRYQYAKEEQAVADYNRQLGGQQAADHAYAKAQYIQKTGDNINRMLSEIRTDYNKWQASSDKLNQFEKYWDAYQKYNKETDPTKKAELLKTLQQYKYALGEGVIRNPFTGVFSIK